MTDVKPTATTSSDTTDVAGSAGERFADDWRIWRAEWEQWLTRPFGWLAAVSVNWLDETPREYAGAPGLWWQDEDAAYVDPRGLSMTVQGQEFAAPRRLAVDPDRAEDRGG